MKLPLSLVKAFIDLDLQAAQIAETLTLLGLEVDRIIDEHSQEAVFDISLTPNLGHCMSALGVARELSAALQKPLHRPKTALKTTSKTARQQKIEVSVADFHLCPRYTCRIIEDVKIAPSPSWLQKVLLAAGLSPICNAVDIANYMMLKTGQPFHIFDLDQIHGGKIEIASSLRDQAFLGLDGIERVVPAKTLLISDTRSSLAIAGVLGGKTSAVSGTTKNLLIEAAIFDPKIIREASKKMAFRSESSQRFEKGVDPNGTLQALDEACALLLEICGGSLLEGVLDLKQESFAPRKISCHPKKVNQLLGSRLSLTEIEQIFHRLGFTSKEEENGTLSVSVPRFRSDLFEEIDLIEEVSRIYGYHHFEQKVSHFTTSDLPHHASYLFEKKVREVLVGFGLQEFLTSDLISQKLSSTALEWMRKGASLLTALHAKTEEYSILRPSLLPGLLQVAKNNLNYKNEDFSGFELGNIHFLQNEQVVELATLALLFGGKRTLPHWSQKIDSVDFFDLKGTLEKFFEKMRIPTPHFQTAKHPSFHPARQANLIYEENLIGSCGEIHPALLEKYDIKHRLYYAELNLHLLMELEKKHPRMHSIPSLPSSQRDWTISLPLQMPIDTLFNIVHSIHEPLLEKVELIDLYIPEGKSFKNATVRFTYRDLLKTISFEEVEKVHAQLIDKTLKLLAK